MKKLIVLNIFLFFVLLDASSQEVYRISKIRVVGLKKTQEYVIPKLLPFESGDTISKNQLEEWEQKAEEMLVNSLLFSTVDVQFNPVNDGYTDVLVVLSERWYLWPFPILDYADPNFNTWLRMGDWSRTNFGLNIADLNFRGRNEQLNAVLQFGYSKYFSLKYDAPFFSSKKNIGLGGNIGYQQRHEVILSTNNNKRVFYEGVDGASRAIASGSAYISFNKNKRHLHTLRVGYVDVKIVDSVAKIEPRYFNTSSNSLNYMTLEYYLKFDYRNNRAYPLKGWFYDASIVKNGFEFEGKNSTNHLAIRSTVKGFKQLYNRFYIATSITGKYYSQTQKLPYFNLEALGYYYNLRGYEYNVIDGQKFLLLKSNIKYTLVNKRYYKNKKLEQTAFSRLHYAFYLNLFADAGYVNDQVYNKVNPLSNQWLYSYGVGLDFVTVYDRVVRFEYSINKQNIKGFYLNFVQPI